jgi:hypothetical protein
VGVVADGGVGELPGTRCRLADTRRPVRDTLTWLLDRAGRQLLTVGAQVVSATREAAQPFVRNLEEFGKPFADLWASGKTGKSAVSSCKARGDMPH